MTDALPAPAERGVTNAATDARTMVATVRVIINRFARSITIKTLLWRWVVAPDVKPAYPLPPGSLMFLNKLLNNTRRNEKGCVCSCARERKL